jgi:hypothetical protein
MVPGQQSFIAVRNFTLNGTQDGNGTEFIQGTSMVSVPITHSQPQVQQQVQQVWVPVQQPPQVLQAYYPAAPRVVQGTKVISTTVTPIAPPSQPGMVIKGGFGWGKMAKPQQGRVWGGQGFGGQGFGGQGFVGMKAAGGVVMQPAAGGMVMGGAVRPAMGASMGASARTNWGTSSSSAGGSSTGSDDSSSSSSNSSSDQGSQQVAPSGGSNQPNIIIVKQADTQSSGSPAAADADAGSSQP